MFFTSIFCGSLFCGSAVHIRKDLIADSLRLALNGEAGSGFVAPSKSKKRGNSWLIFTCDWLKIVLNKNNLIKGYCYEGKIVKPQLPI